MKPLIKICGLSHAESVDAAVAAGADALGFVFAPSIREVNPRHAALIASKIPRQVLRVAVMLHPTVLHWREVEAIFCPDVLQTDAADFDYLDVPADIARWPVLREGPGTATASLPATFVYEGPLSGSGKRVDWQAAGALAKRGNLILAGGLDCGNVAQAIEQVRPYGVDVSSAVESAPGIKDPRLIQDFVRAARAAAID